MTSRAIVNAVVFKAPVEKISKSGKPYVIATIREGRGDAARWWKVFAFSESAIEAILSLSDGEPITVSGEFDCELYAPASGESRLSWKITADAILSARAKPKPKAEKAPRAERPQPRSGHAIASASWASPAREAEVGTPLAEKGEALNDDIPF